MKKRGLDQQTFKRYLTYSTVFDNFRDGIEGVRGSSITIPKEMAEGCKIGKCE